MHHRFSLDDVPVYFRIGSVGAGLGVGCGIGVGFGQPLNLGAVPAMGQAVAGMSSGLGQVSCFLGGAGTGVREAVRRLGVKGLDAGLGCGVGVGYGFGAGLFLKPSAAEQLARLAEDTAGNLARHTKAKLQQVGLRLQLPEGPQQQQFLPASQEDLQLQQPSRGGGGDGARHPTAPPLVPPQQPHAQSPGDGPLGPFSAAAWRTLMPADPGQQQSQQQPQDYLQGTGEGARPQPHATASATALPAADSQPESGASREPSAEEFRALLRHERQIARLRAQNRALRSAVCKLDRRLPLCKEKSDDDGGGESDAW
ncbi:hypothetical protein PLESTB_000405500 [Pleodorina starrii]|uniref:Uncharacterized protein n=1 Tax=Pleodorina starrii TaxID=330485 RepID=A0A9W6EZ43_9CHLO|nr:hypothetical protein PLESTM_001500900 [Pleodorina starrii]GLC50668.1 hypothetical protein PLESTB_000405500 [Pleodorina starrii]GLC75280.1 hypothetical protein PLESTF_001616900 [Pleodorina starrii]